MKNKLGRAAIVLALAIIAAVGFKNCGKPNRAAIATKVGYGYFEAITNPDLETRKRGAKTFYKGLDDAARQGYLKLEDWSYEIDRVDHATIGPQIWISED